MVHIWTYWSRLLTQVKQNIVAWGKTDQTACVFIKTQCIQLHAWHAYIVHIAFSCLGLVYTRMHQQVAYCVGVVWCKYGGLEVIPWSPQYRSNWHLLSASKAVRCSTHRHIYNEYWSVNGKTEDNYDWAWPAVNDALPKFITLLTKIYVHSKFMIITGPLNGNLYIYVKCTYYMFDLCIHWTERLEISGKRAKS